MSWIVGCAISIPFTSFNKKLYHKLALPRGGGGFNFTDDLFLFVDISLCVCVCEDMFSPVNN